MSEALTNEIERSGNACFHGLSFFFFQPSYETVDKSFVLIIELLLLGHLQLDLFRVLFFSELVVIFDRLSPELFLSLNRFFFTLSLLRSLGLLALEFFLVPLELQLHLVLGPLLGHFSLVLESSSALFVLLLYSLDIELPE